jgi:hypothetical protein
MPVTLTPMTTADLRYLVIMQSCVGWSLDVSGDLCQSFTLEKTGHCKSLVIVVYSILITIDESSPSCLYR